MVAFASSSEVSLTLTASHMSCELDDCFRNDLLHPYVAKFYNGLNLVAVDRMKSRQTIFLGLS